MKKNIFYFSPNMSHTTIVLDLALGSDFLKFKLRRQGTRTS